MTKIKDWQLFNWLKHQVKQFELGAERKDETSIDDVNYYASTNDSAERAEDANFGGLGSPLLLW